MSEDDRQENIRNMRERLEELERQNEELLREKEAFLAEQRKLDVQSILEQKGFPRELVKVYPEDGEVTEEAVEEWAIDLIGPPKRRAAPGPPSSYEKLISLN